MYPHGGQPNMNKRSPIENSPPCFAGGELPPPGTTPPWSKSRKNRPGNSAPTPPLPSNALPPLHIPAYALPPREFISIPPQAKSLTVAPLPEDPVLANRVPRPKGSQRKGRPHNITVVPAQRPIARVTAHTPSVPPPISAVLPRTICPGNQSAPGTPYTPEPSDPGLSTGLPRALGMQSFPIRAERPWRHGGREPVSSRDSF
ncbi:hypothetical protein B0H12DRAFT_1134377 [Mycena haematopus]|nr:hypothetical protein B0H12DRAFT_1134377 [Mycena haematopus]